MKLDASVGELAFVGPAYEKRLAKLEIRTIKDLLYHFPHRYIDFRKTTKIRALRIDELVTIKAKLISIKNVYTKTRKIMQEGIFEDETGKLSITWFNQPFLVRSLKEGEVYTLSGKVGFWGKKITLASPEFEKKSGGGLHTGRLVPIYPETAGVTSKWLRRIITNAFKGTGKNIEEFLPAKIIKENQLLGLPQAIKRAHFPKNENDIKKAKERLSFDELLFLHLNAMNRKKAWEKNRLANKLSVDKKAVEKFIASFPFTLTDSQKKAVDEILSDLKKEIPMNRLLEGDVGSGKTVVAAVSSFVTFLSGHQVAFMAPTQILARQHYQTLKKLLAPYKVRVKLITSTEKSGDKGRADLFIGTHSLIHKSVDFSDLGLVVIDEQHRFGVEQREHLVQKMGKENLAPHVLTMTATPIPRTVALTFYGDLALSTLSEMPKGRKPITTWVVPEKKRKKAYLWMEREIKEKKVQAFVICPLIEESEKESMVQIKAVTAEFEKIKKLLPKIKVGLLHGRQKADKKKQVVKDFVKGKIDILVSTPVVEVGIDVPNATVMVIEAAERFGLAQLHQLRGRVGRGKKKSYCLLFKEKGGEKAEKRLSALTKTLSGFELAELDLKLRGPGEIFGKKQHGFVELKIASWSDFSLIKRTKKIAERVFDNRSQFKKLMKILENEYSPF